MQELIKRGHVFITARPCSRIKKGKSEKYIQDEKEIHQGNSAPRDRGCWRSKTLLEVNGSRGTQAPQPLNAETTVFAAHRQRDLERRLE